LPHTGGPARSSHTTTKKGTGMAEYNGRVAEVSNAIIDSVRDVLVKQGVTYDEYAAAIRWIKDLAGAGEVRMVVDNFFESTVERSASAGRPGSEGAVEGPYYVPGAPLLAAEPYVMPMREDEPGDPILLGGQVVDLDGGPVAGALVDVWHAGNDGTYSGFVGDAPRFNLRCRLLTDAGGRFRIRTIRPAPYRIPHHGPTGRLLEMLGRHAWRPGHFHLKVSADGREPITTQLYFRGGAWLDGDGDVSGAVKESLMVDVVESGDADVAQRYGLGVPFSTTEYTFRLRALV
jgi:catechol 1,2-dioxygenase